MVEDGGGDGPDGIPVAQLVGLHGVDRRRRLNLWVVSLPPTSGMLAPRHGSHVLSRSTVPPDVDVNIRGRFDKALVYCREVEERRKTGFESRLAR